MSANTEANLMSAGEVQILASLGHLILFWNRCEYAARQILRLQVTTGNLNSPEHAAISKKTAWELGQAMLILVPVLSDPGRSYVAHFAKAYEITREHRNRFVHGLWATVNAGGLTSATGVLMGAKPKAYAIPMPGFFTDADLRVISGHVWELAEFGRLASIAFTSTGERRLNHSGEAEIAVLPPFLPLLPPATIDYFTVPPSGG